MNDLERLMSKVQPEPNSGCWLWLGANNYKYPCIKIHRKQRYAHRVSYELHKRPIPKGLDIDHLCKVTLCVNPDHLEAVTRKVNVLRSNAPAGAKARAAAVTHCPQGHLYDEANTMWRRDRRHYYTRVCRACTAAYHQLWWLRRKGVTHNV